MSGSTPLHLGAKSFTVCFHAVDKSSLLTHASFVLSAMWYTCCANIRTGLQVQAYNSGSISPLTPKAVPRIKGKALSSWGPRAGPIHFTFDVWNQNWHKESDTIHILHYVYVILLWVPWEYPHIARVSGEIHLQRALTMKLSFCRFGYTVNLTMFLCGPIKQRKQDHVYIASI